MGVRDGDSRVMAQFQTQQLGLGKLWVEQVGVGPGATLDMRSQRCLLTSVWRREGQLTFLIWSSGERLGLEK